MEEITTFWGATAFESAYAHGGTVAPWPSIWLHLSPVTGMSLTASGWSETSTQKDGGKMERCLGLWALLFCLLAGRNRPDVCRQAADWPPDPGLRLSSFSLSLSERWLKGWRHPAESSLAASPFHSEGSSCFIVVVSLLRRGCWEWRRWGGARGGVLQSRTSVKMSHGLLPRGLHLLSPSLFLSLRQSGDYWRHDSFSRPLKMQTCQSWSQTATHGCEETVTACLGKF